MQQILILVLFSATVYAGFTVHDDDEGGHAKATSHQNIHIVHYHPVPTFIKKEYSHLLKHPISIGESSRSLEVHHGGKHDYGYAFDDSHSTINEGSDDGGDGQQGNDNFDDDGSFGHGDYGSQEGGDGHEEFEGNFHGSFGGYGGQYEQGGESEDGGAENGGHKDY